MTEYSQTESTQYTAKVLTPESWQNKITSVRQRGLAKAAALKKEGRAFHVEILCVREVSSVQPVPLSAAIVELDWMLAAKLEMVESARDFITNAYVVGSLDKGLPSVLSAIIEGRGLFEHSIGEFFLLYGMFEQKHRVQGMRTRSKMLKLIGGDQRYLKPYVDRGKKRKHPLPYAVRNILAHSADNPNSLDQNGNDLRTSVDLLRRWTGKRK